jgi:CheY-like chemotaxis protein/HPt (histidine-containing phosphotransfer) domain-containing protein
MPEVDGFMLARQIKQDARLRTLPIVLLTSVARSGDADRCRRIGVEACLTKPVKHSDLLDTLATIIGVSTRADRARPAARAPVRPARQLRLLVAEDNPVNRKLVTTLLRKRGHIVKAVENGRQAVDAVRTAGHRGFDVVVMDVQMPEMSGIEATQAIRARERADGARLPIVALTAHAMQGDRERCLGAGMDGYLSKPIDVDELLATVERVAGDVKPAEASAPPPVETVFDEHAALACTGGDGRLLAQIIRMFRSDSRSSLARIGRAVEERDGEGLRMAAHAFKGAIATVGAPRARAAAAELEQIGRSSQFHDADAAHRRLRDEVALLDRALLAAGFAGRPARSTATRRRASTGSKKKGQPKRSRRR